MDTELKNKWIEALRSGKYKQGTGQLNVNDESFCCLGVLCEIAQLSKTRTKARITYSSLDMEYDDIHGCPQILKLSDAQIEAFKLNRIIVGSLMGMNDSGLKSFSEIADYIEKEI